MISEYRMHFIKQVGYSNKKTLFVGQYVQKYVGQYVQDNMSKNQDSGNEFFKGNLLGWKLEGWNRSKKFWIALIRVKGEAY